MEPLLSFAVLVDQHWIPVFTHPNANVLHVHTWDGLAAQHDGLNRILHQLSHAWGFDDVLVCREQRIFFTSNLCGALAIAFLRFALTGQLPTNVSEAEYIHNMLRDQFVSSIQSCQVAHRPWV